MTPEEIQYLAEVAKTDDDAFAKLYDYFLPQIYGYVFKRVGDVDVAEDLTSLIFIKVVEHLPRFTGEYFKSWLYRIATNTIIDYYRTYKKTSSIEDGVEVRSESATPHEQVQEAELRSRVHSALKNIPTKYSSVLHLKFFADLSNEEIATSLRIKPNNAGVLIYRALKAFEKYYTPI